MVDPFDESGLRAELTAWAVRTIATWDRRVEASRKKSQSGGQSLWDGMPAIDSKAVTETSPIFQKFLGIPLNQKFIRWGGYTSPQDLVNDLLPRMLKDARRARSSRHETTVVAQ